MRRREVRGRSIYLACDPPEIHEGAIHTWVDELMGLKLSEKAVLRWR
jgi:hypothetical protein